MFSFVGISVISLRPSKENIMAGCSNQPGTICIIIRIQEQNSSRICPIHRAQNLADQLSSQGWPTACIAGCLDQKERNDAMARLKSYKCRILISTDLVNPFFLTNNDNKKHVRLIQFDLKKRYLMCSRNANTVLETFLHHYRLHTIILMSIVQ